MDSTSFKVAGKSIVKSISIGKQLNNITIYILDKYMRSLPIGVIGELYIGGDGLARGYLNRPDLTKERFLDNPFASDEDRRKGRNLRLYKTGDLCRYLPDGNIEFIGRNDDQIKIRGFRVELGEIESKLNSYEGVKQSVVLCREKNNNKYLAAYYTLNQTPNIQHLTSEDLRNYLSNLLPDYMVPSVFVEMESFPLNTSGKIDRKALPNTEFKGDEDNYVSPRNETEEKLCQIWQELLGVEKIGINDNFFRLGGNSILAIRVSSVISKTFNIEFRVSNLFNYQTIFKISEYLKTENYQEIILLNEFKKSSSNIVFIHPGNGGCEVYKSISSLLNSEFNCYGIDNHNMYCKDKIDDLYILAETYLSHILAKNISLDSLVLAGWSLGGQIALAISSLIEEKYNIKIKIVLFDTILPDYTLSELRSKINNEEMILKMTTMMKENGFTDEYIYSVVDSFPYERKIGETIIRGKINSDILLFKATQPDLMIKSEITDRLNSYVLSLPDNNISKISDNLKVIKLNCHHGNILEQEEELTSA